MPMISIIVPVYNVEKYLHKCIDSILAQTFTDFELILVDDGSPDNCPKICDEYAKQDDRIIVIHKANGGLSDARNAGIDIAKGEYIGFVDSDDYIESEMYENLFSAIKKHNADLAVCPYSAVDEVGDIIYTWPILEEEICYEINDFLKDYCNKNRSIISASACNKLYRREVFNTLRYPVGKLYEDSFVILDILNQCKKLVFLKNSYYNYFTLRTSSIMNSPFTHRNFDIIELAYKNYSFFKGSNFPAQKGYALLDYCDKYMKVYLATRILYKKFRRPLKPYIIQYRALSKEINKCDEICNLKKATLAVMPIFPRAALKICQKYFPESLYDFMK